MPKREGQFHMISTLGSSAKMLVALGFGVIGGAATEKVVDAATHVPIGVAVSVIVTAVGIAIAISRAMQRIQDSIDKLQEHVQAIDVKLNELPCQHVKCESEAKAK